MPETSDILNYEEIRLSRVASVTAVCGIAWLAFGTYYLSSGRTFQGSHAVFQGVLGILFSLSCIHQPQLRKCLAVWWGALIVVGLTVDACLGGIELSIAPMFYSCAVVVTAMTLGRRAATQAIFASIVAILALNSLLPSILPPTSGPQPADYPLGFITLLGVIGSCLLFAESTAEAFATKLASTTDDLLERTFELNKMVGVDSLTSLANRRSFRQDALQLVESNSESEGFVLLLLDLNDFKQVNDRFGHIAGDHALRVFATEFKEKFQGLGNTYRMGGDEFVAMLPGKRHELAELLAEAEERLGEISLEFLGKAIASTLSVSCGAAVFPSHASSLDELVSNADRALYKCKGSRNTIVVFNATMAEEAERKRKLLDDLNEAVDCESFELNYQPLVEVSSNRIAGAEALIRWNRRGKPVSPMDFIPHLEANERIVEVGTWVLSTACEQLAKWRQELSAEMQISVNVSVIQIQRPNFAGIVLDILNECGLPGSALDLEVTESLLVDRGDIVLANIEELVAHQVSFSIDDFGTGYSSLSYLKRLTVNRLKIDRSFIKDIPESDDGTIAETIITLARYLNLTVVAEGVELPSQLAFLKKHGCEHYQGYLFGKPVPAADFTKILTKEKAVGNKQISLAPGTINLEGLTEVQGYTSEK